MIEHEYARQAQQDGLKLEASLGTNPFKFGFVSSTDTHTGLTIGAKAFKDRAEKKALGVRGHRVRVLGRHRRQGFPSGNQTNRLIRN
jgi:hypothetical protein